MRTLLMLAVLAVSHVAIAGVLNVEFHFAPYTGELKADKVKTVAGKATVSVNNIPVAEQDIKAQQVPVLFEDREVSAAVWVSANSLGSAVRKGKNTLRVDFTPSNAKAPYNVQFRWASVVDEVTETTTAAGKNTATNQADEGVENKNATGAFSIEREFTADFATDQPWHHAPAIDALTEADTQAIAALVSSRVALLKPDYSAAYATLASIKSPGLTLDIEGMKKVHVVEQAAKLKVSANPIDTALTGSAAVVVRSKKGQLFNVDTKALSRIKSPEMQMGVGIILGLLLPPQMVVVKDGNGGWKIVN